MPRVTMNWLESQAKQLVKKHWGINEIPQIKLVTRNNPFAQEKKLDWDSYAGFYFGSFKTIVLNNENNERYTLREIKRILLHELCHWRLHTTGEPWDDSDERFARELIRVGLGKRHNTDEQSRLAAELAKKRKKQEFFEIIERNESETITIRMRHPRKNVDDFKRDLAHTIVRMQNEREEDEYIYPADVAEKMSEWYGYRLEPIAVFGIEISADGGYRNGDIGNKDDTLYVLQKLDMEEEFEDKLFAATE